MVWVQQHSGVYFCTKMIFESWFFGCYGLYNVKLWWFWQWPNFMKTCSEIALWTFYSKILYFLEKLNSKIILKVPNKIFLRITQYIFSRIQCLCRSDRHVLTLLENGDRDTKLILNSKINNVVRPNREIQKLL